MKNDIETFINGQPLRKLFDREFEVVRERYRLRQVELDILCLLARLDTMKTEKEIAALRCLSKAHVSKSIENLKEKGYIAAEEGKEDRRRLYLHVTEEGKKAAESIGSIRNRILDNLYDGITEEEREVFLRVMKKMTENVNRQLLE